MKFVCTKNTCYAVLGGVLVLTGMFAYLGFARPPFPRVYFAETGVRCLPKGHEDLALAWKMHLAIFVDDAPEAVPANIGNTMQCMTELHTHQNDGIIYVELYDEARIRTLSFADFMNVWGVSVQREGYTLRILVDGQEVPALENIPLKDGSAVELRYTKVSDTEKKDDEGKG